MRENNKKQSMRKKKKKAMIEQKEKQKQSKARIECLWKANAKFLRKVKQKSKV